MSKIRILTYAWSFIGLNEPTLEAKFFEECTSLAKKIKLTVITEEISDSVSENISLIKISKISIPIIRTLIRILLFSKASIEQRKKYDLVFIRTLNIPHLLAGILVKKLFKKKLIVWISSSISSHKGIRKKIFNKITKIALDSSDKLVSSSEQVLKDTENKFTKNYRQKLIILKQFVNMERFKKIDKKNQKNIIISVGRISRVKAFEQIIQAIPFVIKSIPDAKLKIVGQVMDQKYLQYLKELTLKLKCEKNIEFLGPIPHNKLVDLYNSSNIFVLTSESEEQSHVTLEAMACELPIIITPVSEVSNLIEEGKNGFLINSGQPEILADKITMLLQDGEFQERIGKAARKTVYDNYSETKFINELLNLFNKNTT